MGVKEVSATYSAQQITGVLKGYKQTEVGVIPEDWEAVTLESVTPLNVKNGIVDGPFGSNLKTIHYRSSGIPIITSGYVTNGRFYAESYLYVDKEKFLEEKRSAVSPGDIVMAKIGERCGASAILPSDHERGILSGNALKISVDNSRYSTFYVWQYLWMLHTSGGMELLRTVGAQPALSMANLKIHKIPVPPSRLEQNAIANALNDADALIESLEQLLTKKRQLKQGTMHELLTGKKRLPGFSGDWEITSLSALCGMKSGDGITSVDIDDFSQYPCYGGNGLRGYASRFTHDGGFALIGRQGALCGNVVGVEGKFFASEHAVVVTPYSQTDIRWLTYVLATMNLNQYSESSAQPGLSVSKILMLDLDVPPSKSEQTAIAAILADMDTELAALEEKLIKARAVKQGMMQELLTGRIRFSENFASDMDVH